MLSRRILLSHVPLHVQFFRSFATTNSFRRAPSISDITSNGASTFDERQLKFREQLKEVQREKEKQDSQFVTASRTPVSSSSIAGGATTAQHTSNAGLTPDSQGDLALGSLSTHNTGAARESTFKQESHKRKGALSSLIYGTQEGRQMDQEIEKSFSQVLARGKYVHSIVFHSVKPDKVDQYVDLVGGWYPRMAKIPENHVNLVGSWRTEVGDCDTFGEPTGARSFQPVTDDRSL